MKECDPSKFIYSNITTKNLISEWQKRVVIAKKEALLWKK